MSIKVEPEAYAAAHTTPLDGAVAAAADWTTANRGGSAVMMAGLVEAQLLTALVRLSGATNVLEIGTFTGVGTLSLASGLRRGGQVTTLEIAPDVAAVARRNIEASPWAGRINLLVGDAKERLAMLPGPYDLVWLDAWKHDYPAYWAAVRTKLTPGGLIAADNMMLGGRVLDPAVNDPETEAMRSFADLVQADPEFDNVLLNIGDGVLLAWRRLEA